MVKNCDLGLENAALGLRPRTAFSRPRSEFFVIRTSQPANNTYIYFHDSLTLTKKITLLDNAIELNLFYVASLYFSYSITFMSSANFLGETLKVRTIQ